MNFNSHSHLAGKHAFLSPSSYHWLNYDDQKLEARFISAMAARRGTDLHLFAQEAIRLGIKLPNNNATLSLYVNDAIRYRMNCEVPLFYSYNCFGHCDAISFRRNKLRISDLKNGVSPASHKQLEVYAALFCLEYVISPYDIETELRIYQRDDVFLHVPEPELIKEVMDKIVEFDQKVEALKQGDE